MQSSPYKTQSGPDELNSGEGAPARALAALTTLAVAWLALATLAIEARYRPGRCLLRRAMVAVLAMARLALAGLAPAVAVDSCAGGCVRCLAREVHEVTGRARCVRWLDAQGAAMRAVAMREVRAMARGGVRRREAADGGGRRRTAVGGGIQHREVASGVGRWRQSSGGGGGAWERSVRERIDLEQMRLRRLRPLRGMERGRGARGRVRPCRVVKLESSFSTGQDSEAVFG
jgi:hypothetical protein